jgi:hypothetical protein
MLALPVPRLAFLIRLAAFLGASLILAYLATVVGLRHAPGLRLTLGNGLLVLAGLLASGGLVLASWVTVPRERLSWALLALAQLCSTLGDLIWMVYDVGFPARPIPPLADLLYLGNYPLFVLAVLLLPLAPGGRLPRLKLLLDTAILALGAGIILWCFLPSCCYCSGSLRRASCLYCCWQAAPLCC